MQLSVEKIWNSAREHLRSRLNADTYNMWFAPLRANAVDPNCVILEVANEFCEVWLKDNYLSLLQDALTVAAGSRLQVKFKVPNASQPPAAAHAHAVTAPVVKAKTAEPAA